jgi:dethiobiotin synthetase
MNILVVTGAGTEIGKTYVACRLIEALRAKGRAVDALKPVVSGFDDARPEGSDPALLLRALGREVTPAELSWVSPWRFKAPLAANMAARAEKRALSYEEIVTLCGSRSGDPLIIEGAGGLMAPLDDHHTFLDLIQSLNARCVLVTGSYLGAISHTLTALAALSMRGRAPACVLVNESVDGVDLDETLATLNVLASDIRFFGVRRDSGISEPALAAINEA